MTQCFILLLFIREFKMAARGAKSKKVEAVEVQATLDAVRNLDTAKVVSEVNNLQVSLQATLASVSASITNKIQQIATIDDAIKLKQDRLKELLGIDAEAVTLDDLKAQREAEKLIWEKEQAERDAAEKEVDRQRGIQRTRDEEEWQYEFSMQKEREENAYTVQEEDRRRAEANRYQELEKCWHVREEALKVRETEAVELKKLVDSFDAKLKAEVSKAEAILTNVLKKQHEHDKQLLEKDASSAKAVCEMRVQSLQTALEQQKLQLEDVKSQLMVARQDAKEVATSALSASSDRKVAEALRQVVDSRENQPTKTK